MARVDRDAGSDPSAPSASRHETLLVLLVTTTVQALVTMNVVIPAAIAPEMAAKLGVSASLVGVQIGIAYGGAMVLSTVSGTLVRRWGAVRASQAALLLAAIGAAMMAVPNLAVFGCGAVVCGFGYALTNPPASHLLQRVTTARDRNFIFSIKQTSVPLGGIAAGMMAPPVALAFGWQAALLAGTAVALAVMVALQGLRASWDADRDSRISLGQNPFADLGIMWGDMRLRMFAFAAFFYSAMQLSLTTFAVSLLVADLEFGLVEAGVVLAVLQAAGVAGRVFWGWMADRLRDGNAVLLIIAAVSSMATVATWQLSPATPGPAGYGLFAAFSFAAVGWNGVAMAEIARMAPPGLIGAATGGVLVVTFSGILVGPPVFALLHDLTGSYTNTFGLFALVPVLGFLFVFSARRAETR